MKASFCRSMKSLSRIKEGLSADKEGLCRIKDDLWRIKDSLCRSMKKNPEHERRFEAHDVDEVDQLGSHHPECWDGSPKDHAARQGRPGGQGGHRGR